jgi:hypothetical protein
MKASRYERNWPKGSSLIITIAKKTIALIQIISTMALFVG